MTEEKTDERFIINAMRESERRIVEDEKFADEVLPDLTPGERRACSAMPDDLVVFLERSGKMADEKTPRELWVIFDEDADGSRATRAFWKKQNALEFCARWRKPSGDFPIPLPIRFVENPE